MELEDNYLPDTDLDLSFTSTTSTVTTTTDHTFTSSSSSSSSSSARSSLTLSFNDRLSTVSAISSTTTTSTKLGNLRLRDLKLIRHIGSGNLGRVFLCHRRDSPSTKYALKVIDRNNLTNKKLSHVETEAEILSMLDHPYLPTLYSRIDESHYTCLLIDYCPNGDLHSLLRNQPCNRFPFQAVRFFAAEILVALEYLHAIGIVYRDLKPENVLLRDDGHVMLSDFDLCFKADVVPTFRSRRYRRISSSPSLRRRRGGCFSGAITKKECEREEIEIVSEFTAEPVTAFSRSCVGTHEYLAPEIVSGGGHGSGVDWWAFGVFLYEMLYGTTPFKGTSKEQTLRNIVTSSNTVPFPVDCISEEANDLIEKLLVKDPKQRLGCARGAQDIKRHAFFDGIKWPLIRHYKPPEEVRGLVVKKSKVRGGHVTAVSPRRKKWLLWRALCKLLRSKSSNSKNGSNSNYYHYVEKSYSSRKRV